MQPEIFQPHPDLAIVVKNYWTLESPKTLTPLKNIIIPDGCMKLIFHYGDSYKHYDECGQSITLPKCFLIGQLTRPYVVEPMGETGTFFVCFHPDGFFPFSNVLIKDMENKAISLEYLFGEEGVVLAKKIVNATSTTQRITLIEEFLFKQMSKPEMIDQIVTSMIDTILLTDGHLSVAELSIRSEINRRQLTKKFSTRIGLSPKQLSKIIRIQATLKVLLHHKIDHLTSLACDKHFYDQAHFIKDFKTFTGLTPKEFYGDQLKMSLIFENNDSI